MRLSGTRGPCRKVNDVGEEIRIDRCVEEVTRHPTRLDDTTQFHVWSRAAGQVRLPSLTRLSVIVQPWTMRTPPLDDGTFENISAMAAFVFSGFEDSWSR